MSLCLRMKGNKRIARVLNSAKKDQGRKEDLYELCEEVR